MYLIALKFNDSVYYIRCSTDFWEEVYDPSFATPFQTKKEALNWGKTNTTFGEYIIAVESIEELKKYRKWVAEGTVRRKFDIVDKTLSKKYENEGPLEVLNWWVQVRKAENSVRFEDFNTWPQLYEVFQHVHSCGNTFVYNDPKQTGKLAFNLLVRKNSSFDKFKEELNIILPFHAYEEKEWKVFPIFDYYCAEGGNTVRLFYRNENECKVCSRFSDSIKGNLLDCFNYLQEFRYYGEFYAGF